MSVIELQSLSKWYGEVIALNDVTTSISHGITALVGPNGAGKTTMMALALGQLRPSKGTITVMGANPWNHPAVLSRIGHCPEGDSFWWEMTGLGFVRFLAKMSGLGRNARRVALSAIQRVGMTEAMHRKIRTYSKGMRQRIKIAQAITHRPRLLILDEPFTGADPVARHDLAEMFLGLAAEGVDILISSHVLHEVSALTRRILMIHQNRIVAEGDVQQVRRDLHDRPHTIRVRMDQPRVLACDLTALPCVRGLRIPEERTLLIETTRPEQVFDCLPDLALGANLRIQEITTIDEDLEAVFGYLVSPSQT